MVTFYFYYSEKKFKSSFEILVHSGFNAEREQALEQEREWVVDGRKIT